MADMNLDSTTQFKEWQCPPAATAGDKKVAWLNESTEEGQAWHRSQRGYSDDRKAFDTISGGDIADRIPASYRSKVSPNRLKRNVREVVGTLARLRPFWGYHSDNPAYKKQAEMMNKVSRAVYLEQFFDISIKDALKYAAATRRGWVMPIYRREMYGTGRGDIRLLTYGAPCVLPNQLPSSGDWQSAYIVHVLDEMPVAMAHGMFPQFQHQLRPSSSRYWYYSDAIRNSARGNILQRMFGGLKRTSGSTDSQMSNSLVPIRKSYVIDLTVNTTDKEIPMGEPGSSWSYIVPHLGQRIPTGTDPSTGHPTWREATEDDARLYPYRRLIISSDTTCLYDGPGFDWHGMFPGASFCLDAWPWEPLGFSLVHEGYELNESIKKLVRGNMDKASAQLDMSLAYDINAVSSRDAKAFDPMQPRGRIGYDGSAIEGQPFAPIVPPEVLKITAESMEMIKYLEGAMDSQLAINDVMALAKMRAVGSMDDLEKIVEANGPIVEDMSRSMEPPMRDIGVMVKYLIMQYMTTSRVMQYVGPDGIEPEVFDYDPTSLVPSHLPGENPEKLSSANAIKRARTFADNLRFFILPNSLHEITQTLMKLGLIQLKKAGVMIDSQTIAESWQVPNFGTIEGNTVLERWQNEEEMKIEFAARMKEVAGAVGLGAPPGASAPGKNPEGRPPSGNAPPALKSKDGGARSTITESK